MRLVEQEMLLQAAMEQVDAMESPPYGVLHVRFHKSEEVLSSKSATAAEQESARQELAALASRRLMTVWFNAW